MIDLAAATVLLQWATGGLLFCWVTTRHRQVGLGYGWLLRGLYGAMALLAALVGWRFSPDPLRDVAALLVALAAGAALAQSVVRRRAGVANQQALAEQRSRRVAAMTGIDRQATAKTGDGAEFDPRLDLIAPVIGIVGIVLASRTGDPVWLALGRLLAGTLFLGAVSDAMLLGHWYLVQPGLDRRYLSELVDWTGLSWFPVVALLLVPTGMFSVIGGRIDDGWGGILGWFWLACALATIVLVVATKAALKERQYAAVMAATGLLYLAILTAFGTDLVARALLV
jgi:hypothetical protein